MQPTLRVQDQSDDMAYTALRICRSNLSVSRIAESSPFDIGQALDKVGQLHQNDSTHYD